MLPEFTIRICDCCGVMLWTYESCELAKIKLSFNKSIKVKRVKLNLRKQDILYDFQDPFVILSHHFGVVLVERLHDVSDGVSAADGVGPLLPVQVLPSPTTTHLHFANL